MRKVLALFCLLFFAAQLQAGAQSITTIKPLKKVLVPHRPLTVSIDTASAITAHTFNSAALDSLKKTEDFQYNDAAVGQSLWSRFWRWFWRMIDKLFGRATPTHVSSFSTPEILKDLLIVTLAGTRIYFIIKLLGVNNIFSRKPTVVEVPYSESTENIHEISFDEQIEKALAAYNYRLAVRLLYLQTLKQLNDAQLIYWKAEKTNSAYLAELTSKEHKRSFGALTLQFEYVWYGDFPINAQSFGSIQSMFQNFKQQLP